MLKCAIYIRVSTEEQAIHGLSLDTQKDELIDYAKRHDYDIVGIYADEGKTARKSLAKRTELQRLLEDVKSEKIDIIIFTKLDRWFRSVRDYHKVQEILESNNVNWKTIKENYDTSTASGRLHINIMLSVAQDEADRTSERIKAVFQNKLKNGEAISGSLPIGYKIKNKKVVIDDDKSQIAKDVFEIYLKEHSQNKVIERIIEKYDLYLNEKTVRRMLCNKIFIGTYRGHVNFCEPLIDKNTFSETQELLANRSIRINPSDRTFIFTGLLVCAECGNKLTANAQIRNYGQKEYILYKCPKHYTRKICPHSRIIYESKLENLLLNCFDKKVEAYIFECETARDAFNSPTQKVNKPQIKKKLEKLKDLYLNDLIDLDTYKRDYTTLNEQLNYEPPIIIQRDVSSLKSLIYGEYKTIYNSLSKQSKRIFWRKYIDHITIDNENNIDISFK